MRIFVDVNSGSGTQERWVERLWELVLFDLTGSRRLWAKAQFIENEFSLQVIGLNPRTFSPLILSGLTDIFSVIWYNQIEVKIMGEFRKGSHEEIIYIC